MSAEWNKSEVFAINGLRMERDLDSRYAQITVWRPFVLFGQATYSAAYAHAVASGQWAARHLPNHDPLRHLLKEARAVESCHDAGGAPAVIATADTTEFDQAELIALRERFFDELDRPGEVLAIIASLRNNAEIELSSQANRHKALCEDYNRVVRAINEDVDALEKGAADQVRATELLAIRVEDLERQASAARARKWWQLWRKAERPAKTASAEDL